MLAKALGNLASDRSQAPKLLRDYNGLDSAALVEELGPPPEGPHTWLPGYSVYYLAHKLSQGRDITGMDAVMATVDTVDIVFMAKGGFERPQGNSAECQRRPREEGRWNSCTKHPAGDVERAFPLDPQERTRSLSARPVEGPRRDESGRHRRAAIRLSEIGIGPRFFPATH